MLEMRKPTYGTKVECLLVMPQPTSGTKTKYMFAIPITTMPTTGRAGISIVEQIPFQLDSPFRWYVKKSLRSMTTDIISTGIRKMKNKSILPVILMSLLNGMLSTCQ